MMENIAIILNSIAIILVAVALGYHTRRPH